MNNFLSNINSRQLIVHFIACWLFIYAFHTLAYLYDFTFLNNENIKQYQVILKQRFSTDMFIINTVGSIGLFVAYTISWRVSLKNNWFWATPAIIFLITFILYYFNLLGWRKLQYVFLAPGQVFSAWNNMVTILINGFIMLALGLYLLLNKKIIAYIDRGVKRERPLSKLHGKNSKVN